MEKNIKQIVEENNVSINWNEFIHNVYQRELLKKFKLENEFGKLESTNVFAELSLDEISDTFFAQYKKEIPNELIANMNHALINTKDDKIIERVFNKCFYKEGKYYALIEDIVWKISIPCFKILVKEIPNLKIPPIVCEIQNYPFKSEDINYTLLKELLSEATSREKPIDWCNGYIYIDKEKNITATIYGWCKNKDGIPLKYEITYSKKEELENLLNDLRKINYINRLTDNHKIKIVIDDNREFKYIYNGKQVDSLELENILSNSKRIYKSRICERIDEIIKSYNEFLHLYLLYIEYSKKNNDLYVWLTEYNRNINSLKGKLSYKKNNFLNNRIDLDTISINIDDKVDIEFIKEKIYTNSFDFSVIDIDNIDIDKLFKLNCNTLAIFEVIQNSLSLMKVNVPLMEKYLHFLKQEYETIQNQNLINVFKNPIISKPPNILSSIDYKKYNCNDLKKEPDEKTEYFDQLQVIQSTLLSPDEKMALMIYKTKFYYAINQIILYMRNTPGAKLDDCEMFIEKGYLDLKESYEKSELNFRSKVEKKNKFIIDDILSNDHLMEYEEYKKLIYNYLSLIETALNKLCLDKEMTVYRIADANGINTLGNGFLSTSISLECALSFIESRMMKKCMLYKIHLMPNSPIAFFSSELWTGVINHQNPFPDSQQEVLIDGNNFDFYMESSEKHYNLKDCEELEFIEVKAVPKLRRIGLENEFNLTGDQINITR